MTKRVVEKKNEKPNRAVDRKPKVEKRNRKRKKNNPQEDAEKATGKKQKIVEIEKSPQSSPGESLVVDPVRARRQELRSRLTNQLRSAEFRFINEQLYRADRQNTGKILDVESAKIYHEGFSTQVK